MARFLYSSHWFDSPLWLKAKELAPTIDLEELTGARPELETPAWERRRQGHPLGWLAEEWAKEDRPRPLPPSDRPILWGRCGPSPEAIYLHSLLQHDALMHSLSFRLGLLLERWTRRGILRSRFRQTYQR